MRAGSIIKKDQLCYTLSCSTCKAKVVFPLKVPRDKAIENLKKYNGWKQIDKKLHCDCNCGDFAEPEKKSKPKVEKKSKDKNKPEDKKDVMYWLGD